MPFVRIKTLFSNESERNIAYLSGVYADHTRLCQEITDLTVLDLNAETVTGKRIFLKPNWVKHPQNTHDEICLCTHHNFTLATLEVMLRLGPKKVVIGDAPVQSCRWDNAVDSAFLAKVQALAERYDIPVVVKDLRRVVMDMRTAEMVKVQQSLDRFLIFDLGKQSYLEPVTLEGQNSFRVTHYNPDRFLESHTKGIHKYCITRELFEADIVISMPKTKTHEKTGITNALKNIVGMNGDKDFLPHHRIGGTATGGDSYPGNNLFRNLSERAYDQANRNLGKSSYKFWVKTASLLWKLSQPRNEDRFGAGWYGNDTTWRMVMDLNRIVLYGRCDGTVSDTPQRQFFSLCDGIIGGQKDGPLSPTPLALGLICFTDDSAWADIAMAILMSMDITRLPLLMAAKDFSPSRNFQLEFDGKPMELHQLKEKGIEAEMPSGWKNYKA
jgi:uncharacterized protein (DUF362 family)